MSTAFATFKVILGFITMGIFLACPFFLIGLAHYNPFRQINVVWCHGWMAPCQVSFDVQNPRGGTAPGNRTFTGHVFLFAHGHCELQWDHTRACATDFLAHNTCGTCACCACAPTETTRFDLTTHPWVSYHLSLLQVHCHMIAHPCQSNGRSTKQTKFCCFRGPHTSMCHTSEWLCTQLRTIGHLCGFHKGRQGPTGMSQRPSASIRASKKTTCPFRNSHSRPNYPVHRNKVGLVIATKGKN